MSGEVTAAPVSPRSVSEAKRRDPEWDIRSGPGNYAALIGAQAASSAAALAATWIATRALGATGYGEVVAVLAASQFAVQIAVHWTAISVFRYGCEEFVRTGRIASTFWSRLTVLAPNLLLVVALSPLWLPIISSWLHIPESVRLLVLIHLMVTSVWIHIQQSLQGAKLMRLQGVLLALERGLTLLILAAMALAGIASVFNVVVAYVFASLAMCCAGLWRLRSMIYPGISLDRRLLKRLLVFSFPLIPSSVMGYLSTNYLDAIFISYFLSTADLGIYAVAYLVAGTAMQLPLLAGSLLMPLFITFQVADRNESVVRFMRDVLPLLTLLWSTICAIAAAAGIYLVPLIFGSEFRGAANLFWPLMLASALAGPVLMGYWPLANSMGMTYVATVNAVIAACVNVALDVWLIPRYGLVGCAWATAATYGAGVLATISIMHWRAGLPRTGTLHACLPALLGATYAAWRSDYLGALILSLLLGSLLALVRRRAIAAVLRSLINQRRGRAEAQTAIVR